MKQPDGDPARPGGLSRPDTADPELGDDWTALLAAEQAAIGLRRQRVRGDVLADAADLALPRVGLALSGGGVRSATFALGLMRSLACPQTLPGVAGAVRRPSFSANGLLARLDYLSTVSGGGYTGGHPIAIARQSSCFP